MFGLDHAQKPFTATAIAAGEGLQSKCAPHLELSSGRLDPQVCGIGERRRKSLGLRKQISVIDKAGWGRSAPCQGLLK
jgi:hypothetical protein